MIVGGILFNQMFCLKESIISIVRDVKNCHN